MFTLRLHAALVPVLISVGLGMYSISTRTKELAAVSQATISEESVVQFLTEFEKIAERKDFSLISEMIHERAFFRFNDGDFVGRQAVQGAFEKTWQGASKIRDERFYLSDIAVLATDHRSASVTYTYNWEGFMKVAHSEFRAAVHGCLSASKGVFKSSMSTFRCGVAIGCFGGTSGRCCLSATAARCGPPRLRRPHATARARGLRSLREPAHGALSVPAVATSIERTVETGLVGTAVLWRASRSGAQAASLTNWRHSGRVHRPRKAHRRKVGKAETRKLPSPAG